jgi:hypothetical protein
MGIMNIHRESEFTYEVYASEESVDGPVKNQVIIVHWQVPRQHPHQVEFKNGKRRYDIFIILYKTFSSDKFLYRPLFAPPP